MDRESHNSALQMKPLTRTLTLRGLRIEPPLLLAPMAGVTHSALRRIMIDFGGVGLLSTEMLSAKRLPSDSPRVSPYLIRTEREKPISCQLLTSTEQELGRAVDALHAIRADAVDINMGCPAPAVSRFGAGGILMERPDAARAIVAEARRLTGLPLSCKIRLGSEADLGKLKSFCRMLEGEGIDMLSVHARFSHEPFARNPRWAYIGAIKEAVRIPVVANGGIFSAEDAENCLKVSGADGLMLGRGAAIKPWLFRVIAEKVYGFTAAGSVMTLPELYAAFIEALIADYRPIYHLGRLKEFTHYFAGNYKFGHTLATRVQSSGSLEEARQRALLFFANNPEESSAPVGSP